MTSPNDVIERLEARAKRLGRGDYYNWNDAALDRSAASLIKTLREERDAALAEFRAEKALRSILIQDINIRVTQAVETEREECAKVAENMGHSNGAILASHKHVARAIRARSTQDKP